MPRKLPWATKTATTPLKTRRPAKSTSGVPRQQRTKLSAYSDDEEVSSATQKRKQFVSSSPVPEPPCEEFMQEGLDKDDLYRMVEDELLATAQKFTVHLHTAEYKRYQKEVQSKNAQTIKSISRPSVGSISEETKRKIETVQRAEKQKRTLDEVLGRKQSFRSDNDDDSDGGADLPYAGTMLHGLMDSPRKRLKTLSSIVPRTTTSRSAAGYKQPATMSQQSSYDLRPLKESRVTKVDGSSEDDENLDKSLPRLTFARERDPPQRKHDKFSETRSSPKMAESKAQNELAAKISGPSELVGTTSPKTKIQSISDSPPKFGKERTRISRFERARQLKEEIQLGKSSKRRLSLDIIPTFL